MDPVLNSPEDKIRGLKMALEALFSRLIFLGEHAARSTYIPHAVCILWLHHLEKACKTPDAAGALLKDIPMNLLNSILNCPINTCRSMNALVILSGNLSCMPSIWVPHAGTVRAYHSCWCANHSATSSTNTLTYCAIDYQVWIPYILTKVNFTAIVLGLQLDHLALHYI